MTLVVHDEQVKEGLMAKAIKNGLPIPCKHFPFLPSYSLYFLSKTLPFFSCTFCKFVDLGEGQVGGKLQFVFQHGKHIYIPSFPPSLLTLLPHFFPSFPFFPSSFLSSCHPIFCQNSCHFFLTPFCEFVAVGVGWGGAG